MRRIKKENKILKFISGFFTLFGLYLLLFRGDLTNGLLGLILGEVIKYKK